MVGYAGHFTEVPRTLNVTAGNDAVFMCDHSDAAFLGWLINGEPALRANISGVSMQTNSLTILALPEYNGTEVECLALYLDGTSETSPPALLIVQGTVLSSLVYKRIKKQTNRKINDNYYR